MKYLNIILILLLSNNLMSCSISDTYGPTGETDYKCKKQNEKFHKWANKTNRLPGSVTRQVVMPPVTMNSSSKL
jgi:hypothetical protein